MIGCVQPLLVPIARHTSPISPARFPPGQALVLTPYPNAPCSTVPTADVTTFTGDGLEYPTGAPICPTFSPLVPTSCRMTALPLIWPFTEAVVMQG